MSTFYLLPSRPQVGRQFAELLGGMFPGSAWPRADWHDLAEALSTAAMSQADTYVIFSEDLPVGPSVENGLMEYFGAEPGDEVVEVRPGRHLAEVAVQRWRVHESLAA